MHTNKAQSNLRRLSLELPNRGVWRERWSDTQGFLRALRIDSHRNCQDPLHALDTQILHLQGKSTDDPLMRSAFAFREGIRQRPKLQKASELLFKNCFYAQAVYPSAIANQVRWDLQRRLQVAPERYAFLPRAYQLWREEKKTYRKRLDRDFIGYRNFVFDLDQANWDWPNLARKIRRLGLWEFLAAVVETSPRKFHVYFRMDQILMNPEWAGPEAHPLWPQVLGARGASPISIWWQAPAADPGRFQVFRTLWEFLNRELRGDPAVRDGLRLLQLPGFRNPKAPAFFARTIFLNPQSWSLTPEILARLHPHWTAPKPATPTAPRHNRSIPAPTPPPRRDWSPDTLRKLFPNCHPPASRDIRERFQWSLLRWAFIASRVAGPEVALFWKTVVVPYFEAREFNSKDAHWEARAERQFYRCLNSLGHLDPAPYREAPVTCPLPEKVRAILLERGATERQIQRLTPSLHELLQRSRGQWQQYARGEKFALVHFPLQDLRRRGFTGDLTAHRRLLESFGLLVTSYQYSPRALVGGLGIAKTLEFSLERDYRTRPAEFVRSRPPQPPPPFRLTLPLFRRFLSGEQSTPEMLSALHALANQAVEEEYARGFAPGVAPRARVLYKGSEREPLQARNLESLLQSFNLRKPLESLGGKIPALSQALYSSKGENCGIWTGGRWGPSPPRGSLH